MPTQKKVYSYTRFSRKSQAKGSSLQRQTEKAQEYAKKNNLILDTNLRMADLGKSGYFGEHTKEDGALGKFLQLVQNGLISKGSVLVVEALDRLSRQAVRTALKQFMSILDAGISIVTTIDGMVYTPDYDSKDLIISITYMQANYNQSVEKQERGERVWKYRRQSADIKKIVSTGPRYLILNKEKNRFEFKPKALTTLKYIIKLYLEGNGTAKISRILNQQNVPYFGEKSGIWSQRYISSLLSNRALIGKFQPKKYDSSGTNRRLVPTGEVLIDYFPKAIDDDTFYKIQKEIGNRKQQFNKKGKYTNLFTNIARCGYCNSTMHIVCSGKKKHSKSKADGKYLACSLAKKGGKCTNIRLRYTEFELAFLKLCKNLSVRDIIEDTTTATTIKINSLTDTINTDEHKLVEISLNVDKILDLYLNNEQTKDLIEEKLLKEQNKKVELESSLKENRDALQYLTQREDTAEEQLQKTKDNITLLQTIEGEKLANLRMTLHNRLYELVDHIFVYSIGTQSIPENAFSWKQPKIRRYTRDNKCFVVKFADGGLISCRYDKDAEEYKVVYETDDVHKWSKIPDKTFPELVKSFQNGEIGFTIGKPISFLSKSK